MDKSDITPDLLLRAYMAGIFPMSEGRDDPEIFWVDPEERGIFPLNSFHIPKSLKKTVARDIFTVTTNRDFRGVMQACAAPAPNRTDTWINETIEDLYCQLHESGFAHSIECWQEDTLVGGLYGVCIQGAFFGESMFSTVTDASKVALTHLVARLIAGKFTLLDSQFKTDHLARFGCTEIIRDDYLERLAAALQVMDADYFSIGSETSGSTVLQLITQTS